VNQFAKFPLNSVGTSTISKTGYSQFCIREGHDATNHEPVNNGSVWLSTGILFNGSEAAGTSTDPYLDITYTDAGGGTSTPPLQDLVYTYDNVGNITSVTDNTNTNAPKATVMDRPYPFSEPWHFNPIPHLGIQLAW
jgi:hypothetical protein